MTARTRFFPHEFRGPSVPGSQQRGPKRQQLGYFSSLLNLIGANGLPDRGSGWTDVDSLIPCHDSLTQVQLEA